MKFWDFITTTLGLSEVSEPVKKRSPQITPNLEMHGSKISIQTPVDFNDITRFVRSLNKNIPLIVNFSSLKPNEAERSLDFVCGAVCALNGKLERIGDGIYFYAPAGVSVETDKKYKGKRYGN